MLVTTVSVYMEMCKCLLVNHMPVKYKANNFTCFILNEAFAYENRQCHVKNPNSYIIL